MTRLPDSATLSAQIRDALHLARRAQQSWQAAPVRERARRVGGLRSGIAEHAKALALVTAHVCARPPAEKLVSEVLPLADACHFLERSAAKILRTQRFGRLGRPWWLSGSSFTIERVAHGVVLVVGPKNYPLFLPGVQLLQALAAGNAVLLKPAPQATAPLAEFIERVVRLTDIPPELIHLLPESPEAAHEAVRAGIDHVVFTGSSEHGRDLLATMATRNTPGVMELSGADPVFVLRDADPARAAKAIAFGRQLNAGDTCMAPHAIFAHREVASSLRQELSDIGLGSLEITVVADEAEALDLASSSEQGLGASVFSRDEKAAQAFARELHSGFVTINDLIVPTADPRLPFGGIRGSGYGVTRGSEGLLAMTHPHVVATRRGRRLPHLEATVGGEEEIFAGYIGLAHRRGLRPKIAAVRSLIAAARAVGKRRNS